MRAPKKPPPDTEGNIRGRMCLLRAVAKQSAQVEERDGGDYGRAFAKHMRALEPRLVKLRARLVRARKGPSTTASEKCHKIPSGPVEIPPSKRTKARDADLLDELGAL